MTFAINDIPPAKHLGYHEKLTADPDSGLSARLTAIDYSGECEVLARRCELFSHLGGAIPDNVRSIIVATGHAAEDYSGFELTRVMDDINEKITQWIAVATAIADQARIFEAQLASAPSARFEFYAPVRQLESHVEHYCFKVVSILDLYARLARCFNRTCSPCPVSHPG